MKLSAHLSRRLVAGVGLASAAILLPAAALASSAAPAAKAAPAVACGSSVTELWSAAQSDGAAGSSYFQIELSNIRHTTCTLFGYPGVSTLDIHGHQVGLSATHGGGRVTATLVPGGTAHFVLKVTNAGAVCGSPVNTSTLRVFAPGQTTAKLIGFPSQACLGHSLLFVDSVHNGTGIPGFSIQ